MAEIKNMSTKFSMIDPKGAEIMKLTTKVNEMKKKITTFTAFL